MFVCYVDNFVCLNVASVVVSGSCASVAADVASDVRWRRRPVVWATRHFVT